MRHDANGPVIRWVNYGCEGWQPQSFDTVKQALEEDRFGAEMRITRPVVYEIQETRHGDTCR